ncbi:MAG: FAD-binding protein [Ilumatobacter sp.]|uniref:FAD-binding protein n=1 Tax=Ilumatobacter sp. TaxID=1967498 RepID=UPI002605D310|nr:FAD-binding protein [Ilumatobacter sp.]MDJ0767388.1 FAD-binding protein [Ilumatobacter sp.]
MASQSLHAIALVKQVPDLRVGSVGVRADGTIDRSAATPITNPADMHAVEAAVEVADDVVALSMGPPQAESTLREAIAAGASRGVLLCDRALAGSDTWATANALAAAVEHLDGVRLVVAGISAIDGETGQVGPSVAQRLGWPQATACESMTVDGDQLVVRRIIEGGYERLRLPLPAVVTVAETGFAPRYPTLPDRRRARAAPIERLGASDIGVDGSVVGLAASPTKVAKMNPAALPDRGCRLVDSDGFRYDDLVEALTGRGAFTGGRIEEAQWLEQPRVDHDGGSRHDGDAGLWVLCHCDGSTLDRASIELLSRSVSLAPDLGGGVGAVLLTSEPADEAVAAAAWHGADVVYLAVDPELAEYRTEPYARVIVDAVTQHRPAALLFAATTTGRDLAPRIASMLDTGLAADCTDLRVGSWTSRGATHDHLLHMVRPAMAGGVLATCLCPEARPQMATVRPGVFAPRVTPRNARVVQLDVRLTPSDLRVTVLDQQISEADVDLRDADVIVAGGAGCDATSWHLIEDLSSAIGGRVAASRGAVEAGLAERDQQIGQTGATVHPRLYVACGISGALQHAVGMQESDTIVAINRNPDAVIFRLAHFGIVGDVAEVVPQLVAAIERRRAS